MSERFDVVIAGGGFAGLACARAAAGAGLSTLVLEAKPEIGTRLHTTGILTAEAHDELRPPGALVRAMRGVRLYGPSRRAVTLEGGDYAFRTTDTEALLRWMADMARAAGAIVRTAARVADAGRAEDGIEVRAGGERVRARHLIGADGARSHVAEMFRLGLNTRFLKGIEREYRGRGTLDPDWLHVLADSRVAPGYIAWACAAPGFTQLGLAVSNNRKPEIDPFLAEAETLFGIRGSEEIERRAGLIPCGGMVRRWHAPGVTLIGDAAGMVSPHTAGGIHLSLLVGRLAGEALGAHLRGLGPEPATALAPHLPKFGTRLIARWLLDLAPPNLLIEAGLRVGLSARAARELFFHHRARARAALTGEGSSAHALPRDPVDATASRAADSESVNHRASP
jgi:flavin-dependent dehydrogenase